MYSCSCELRLASLPRFLKTCPRCNCAFYENSGCFRVNANGKRLDIWLICRCEHCKATWNLSIYERIDRAALCTEDYRGYLANDQALILRHIFDPAFLQKNCAVLDLADLSLSLQGDLPPEGTAAEVHIRSECPLPIPAIRTIALTLGVSLSRVRRMQEAGDLLFDGDLRKTKTGYGFAFTLAAGWRRNA